MNEKYPLALPENTVLAGQYIIQTVLGQGGFGITYKALDRKTGKTVAVKEFFPDTMATRVPGNTEITAYPGDRGENFIYGKQCFLQEAETLAQFIGNENIVQIYSYFEEYGTAYFVMDYIEGTSLDEYVKKQGGKLSYEEASSLLIPVMDALSAVHKKGIVHRDVSPDNIYITSDGKVKLIDFGAARQSLGDKSQSLDVILKHGFAPKEQYMRRGKQGPYTDVYALGATFYYVLTGRKPLDALERVDNDELVAPSVFGAKLPKSAEDAIFKALDVQSQDRFQSMEKFKDALMGVRYTDVENVSGNVASTSRLIPNFDRSVKEDTDVTSYVAAPQYTDSNKEISEQTKSNIKINKKVISGIALVLFVIVFLVKMGGGGEGNVDIIGNSVDNIENYSIYDLDGNIYQDPESGIYFECVSNIDGEIYGLIDNTAYRYNPETEIKEAIHELEAYASATNMLFVSKKYYFIRDKQQNLICIDRKSGKEKGRRGMTATGFTFNDGYLYFLNKNSDGVKCLYRVSADDISGKEEEYVRFDNGDCYVDMSKLSSSGNYVIFLGKVDASSHRDIVGRVSLGVSKNIDIIPDPSPITGLDFLKLNSSNENTYVVYYNSGSGMSGIGSLDWNSGGFDIKFINNLDYKQVNTNYKYDCVVLTEGGLGARSNGEWYLYQ